ncbi:Hypothetical predicted protein [Mytilus galloprovincialis]|uniref:Uncharacterized protein n=1 Tax=Mytilus galloprovincialis TaxID=29158 RepID=A0A8B6FRR4_MYTGA|nr:Hypothetical predicted protein [Mytilus galloprovincialis]
MGAGLYDIKGVNPMVSLHLIRCYVIPRLLYGLEVILLSKTDISNLTTYFVKLLKRIQHLSDRTANAAVLLLIGQIPIEAEIHKRILGIFRNIIENDNSVERESLKDVSIICGKDDSIGNVRLLVHESILLAYSVGARSQRLRNPSSTDTQRRKEDKKISSLISDWAKSKKYEEPSGPKERQERLDAPPASASAFPFPGYGYQNSEFGFPYPNFYPGPNINSGGFRPPKESGHFIANCPKMKKDN